MGKVLALLGLDTDLEASGLGIAQVGAATHLEILLLAGRPCLYVHGLDLEVGQVARAALQGADGDIHGTEQIYGVLPQLVEPYGALLGLADHDHLLLLKLVDAVHASLLDTVSALLLAEAGRIAGEGLGQRVLRQNGVDELADHRVLAGAYQEQVLALDLVHHGLHLGEAHYAADHLGADHVGRNAVGESAVDHKVSGVGDDGRVETGDVTHQIVKAVACHLAGALQVDACEALHDLGVVGDLKIGGQGLAVALDLHVLAIVLADRNGGIDDVGDDHHAGADLFGQALLQLLQLGQTGGRLGHLALGGFSLLEALLSHQGADHLGLAVAVSSEGVCLSLGGAKLLIQSNDLVHQGQLAVLELLADVLTNHIGIVSQKLNVDHSYSPKGAPRACVRLHNTLRWIL